MENTNTSTMTRRQRIRKKHSYAEDTTMQDTKQQDAQARRGRKPRQRTAQKTQRLVMDVHKLNAWREPIATLAQAAVPTFPSAALAEYAGLKDADLSHADEVFETRMEERSTGDAVMIIAYGYAVTVRPAQPDEVEQKDSLTEEQMHRLHVQGWAMQTLVEDYYAQRFGLDAEGVHEVATYIAGEIMQGVRRDVRERLTRALAEQGVTDADEAARQWLQSFYHDLLSRVW